MSKNDVDPVTGTETTGHEWDGIKELNNPLPRWWLWTFYATIIFSVIYMILYPAIPLVNTATGGVLGWTKRAEVERELAEVEAMQKPWWDKVMAADLEELAADPELASFTRNAGAALFRTWCAQCHGSGAAGAKGYPNLLDDDWLWGGTMEDIVYTLRHGIRYEQDPDTRFSEMPDFGEILSEEEIATLVEHVQKIAQGADPLEGPGGALYAENCAACHGEDARGDREQGAPNLADAIWLYGNDTETLTRIISEGPYGVMPAWAGRLSEPEIRALAAYVHQLGGGEPARSTEASN